MAMDALVARLGAQALNYAIRSGIALTSNYAIGQCSRLLKTVDDRNLRAELKRLQKHIGSKIKIIASAISLIELKSGRGNPLLEGALPLAKSLHEDIVNLGRRLEYAATAEERVRRQDVGGSADPPVDLHCIIADMKALLARFERDTPALQLAISVSGESLSTTLPPGISPSRLLQASILLTLGDTQFASSPTRAIQIGPTFTLSLYMLFLGHAPASVGQHDANGDERPVTPGTASTRNDGNGENYGIGEGDRKPLWQEVMHKARARLCRTPPNFVFDPHQGYRPAMVQESCMTNTNNMLRPGDEASVGAEFIGSDYAYHLEIIEDLDDGRVHDEQDAEIHPYDTIPMAGIRESVPIHQLSKIFYTDTGRILNIGNATEGDNNPVLLLKRDMLAPQPRFMADVLSTWHNEGNDYSEDEEDSGARSDEAGESDDLYTQADIDRQLREESRHESISAFGYPKRRKGGNRALKFPHHLDQEWLALEAFAEGDESSSEPDSDGSDDEATLTPPKARQISRQLPLDSRLIAQIKNLSIGSGCESSQPPTLPAHRTPIYMAPSTKKLLGPQGDGRDGFPRPGTAAWMESEQQASFVARSPFGAITTSLSLLEMIIRLASLQEFQQAVHLSIPDYVLTFFLQETSTTGLKGEDGWKVRNEAKRRVGFDPYTDTTDTPTKQPRRDT